MVRVAFFCCSASSQECEIWTSAIIEHIVYFIGSSIHRSVRGSENTIQRQRLFHDSDFPRPPIPTCNPLVLDCHRHVVTFLIRVFAAFFSTALFIVGRPSHCILYKQGPYLDRWPWGVSGYLFFLDGMGEWHNRGAERAKENSVGSSQRRVDLFFLHIRRTLGYLSSKCCG